MILGGLRNAFALVLAIEDDLVNKGARVQVDLSLLRSSKKPIPPTHFECFAWSLALARGTR